MNGEDQVQNIRIVTIVDQLKDIVGNFHNINFMHILIENRQIVDKLSKEGLKLLENQFVIFEGYVGHIEEMRRATVEDLYDLNNKDQACKCLKINLLFVKDIWVL
jgi:hypothetical protein